QVSRVGSRPACAPGARADALPQRRAGRGSRDLGEDSPGGSLRRFGRRSVLANRLPDQAGPGQSRRCTRLRTPPGSTWRSCDAPGRLRKHKSRFTSGRGCPAPPRAADGLLRPGICQQRLAVIMVQQEERKKLFDAARSSYERALVEYPLHEAGPTAAFARARCLAVAGDATEAIKRLQAFATGALKKEPVAPLALLQLAELIGAQEN